MWTQRDQLQAYQFLRRRLVSALQAADANHPVSPSRRVTVGMLLGIVLAVLLTAGFIVYGRLRPGADRSWRAGGQVIIEKQTGAVYAFGADGLLHPVVNYASARLLAGGDGNAVVTVSAESLAAAPRGAPLGIIGAPSSLPVAGKLLTGAWAVCAAPRAGRPDAARAATTLIIGEPVAGTELGAADALLVRDETGAVYAVTGGRRLRLRDGALVALGYETAAQVRVKRSWIDAVPAGPDLALVAVPDSGEPGPRVGTLATRVGQILKVTDLAEAPHYYLVRANGLAPVGETAAALVLGSEANGRAYAGQAPARAIPVSAADVAEAGVVTPDAAITGYPSRLPRARQVTGDRVAVCAVWDGAGRASVRVSDALPLPAGARSLPIDAGADVRLADAGFVPPGSAVLVRAQPAPGSAIGTVYLVTDQAVRYPVAGIAAVKALGYGSVPPVPMAASLLELLPAGPTLDPAAAALEVTGDRLRAGATARSLHSGGG